MGEMMNFPDDWHDFIKSNSFVDSEKIYTNGALLMTELRVEQLVEHILREKEQQWVSVKERLPETDEEVLVTYICGDKLKKRYVETASFIREVRGGSWVSIWDEYRIENVHKYVIAWMPMPKPYKPPKEDKRNDDAARF